MNSFIDILKQEPDPDELARIIKENYTAYRAGGRDKLPANEMLVTGYYEPFLQGSLSRKAPFIYPIYQTPPSLIISKDKKSGKSLFRRKDTNGKMQPFWSRQEIEEGGYCTGSELIYLSDPLDAFFLHVQGSGKIQLRDGSVRSIHYAASNGREYNSIGRLLVKQGKLTLEEASMPTIKSYLSSHPEELKKVLYHNKRFIFFAWAPPGNPVGSIGEPLVEGRSIAIDPDSLPHQALGFLISSRPVLNAQGIIIKWVPLHRFVFPQDSGSAIKGPGRVDLFWGSGNYAKLAAGNMKEKGELYFLVKNNFEEHEE